MLLGHPVVCSKLPSTFDKFGSGWYLPDIGLEVIRASRIVSSIETKRAMLWIYVTGGSGVQPSREHTLIVQEFE
jgi:hypothetical protein